MTDHPSGRPIRRDPAPIGAPMWRIPHTGPVTPRLQTKQQRIEAIGFWHGQADDEDDAT